jgi:uncharacterized membrane protein YfcA
MTFDMALGLWIFIPVGILGAIIANATGTGGGVVFVPVFLALKDGAIPIDPALQDLVTLTAAQTIAVSFTIQCFGMSVGSLNWARAIFVQNALAWYDQVPNATLMAAFTAPLALGIPALLLVQSFVVVNGDELIFYFKIFSLALGTVLLFFTWQQKRAPKSARRLIMTRVDIWALLGLGALGGAVTAVFSVGIGEFLAIYLILRRYPTTIAIAVAVWVSLVCVVVGFWDNFFAGLVVLPVALMAVIGAIIGGYLAKGIAGVLGPLWLKTAASIWIIASSLYLLLT